MLYRQAILRGAALAFLFCGVTTSLACRFNVRDVGFVDLGSKPYQLFCFVNKDTPAELVSQIEDISIAALLDSNIEAEVVNVDTAIGHPALKHTELKKDWAMPYATLVSPEGASIPIHLLDLERTHTEALWTAFESLYEAPMRDKIMESVLNTYGAIILLEGTDAAENLKARAAAEKSIAAIAKLIRDEKLEKEIKNPPVLHVLSRNDASREGVTLWGMGIDVNEPSAQIAMLYGRGRKIGKTLKGAQLNDQTVHAVLNTIGLSCECGLDRSWMQGGMIPLKWGDDIQSQVAKHLGFDPESPAIKMEMSQILSKGGAGQGAKIKVAQADIDTLLAGYSEISATAAESTATPEASVDSAAANSTEAAAEKPPVATSVTKLYEVDESKGEAITPKETDKAPEKRLRNMMLFLGMVAMLVVFAGVFVLFRGRSNG
jgi:hypothetical protein